MEKRTIVYSKGLGDKWLFELSDGTRGYNTKDSIFFAFHMVCGWKNRYDNIDTQRQDVFLENIEDDEVREFLSNKDKL